METKKNDSRRRLARAEERTACQRLSNDKEKIKRRIAYLQLHLDELKDVLEKEDFR